MRTRPLAEELIVYALLVVVGAIPVVVALARHAALQAEATIGLLMICAGALGVILHAVRLRDHRST